MERVLKVVIPYSPRPLQMECHRDAKRWNVLVCHRRWGKTVWAINHLLRGALTNPQNQPRYAYIAPLLKQAKLIAWDYTKFFTLPLPDVTYNESELRCDLPTGARIYLLGSDNPDALRGQYLDGVILDEYAQMPPRLFGEIVRPALSDRQGWAIFLGTPQGTNHFHDLWVRAQDDPEWYARMFKASETGIIPPEELESARKVMSKEQYEQEYECSFSAALIGSYFGEEIRRAEVDGRIGEVNYDPKYPVYTGWDLGIGDHNAIWWAQLPPEGRPRLIDYHEASGVALEHYIKRVLGEPYIYHQHVAPHDLKNREYTSGETRIRFAQRHGINFTVCERHNVQDGIDATRRFLNTCLIDARNCKLGIEALKNYRREWDEKGNQFKDAPVHDWASHGADALRTLIMGHRPPAKAHLQSMAGVKFDPRYYADADTVFDPRG